MQHLCGFRFLMPEITILSDRIRSPLFHQSAGGLLANGCLLSRHSASPTPESSSELIQILYSFHGLRPVVKDSTPSCPTLLPANMTALQNSLYVTDCRFASPSLRDISLRHSQLLGSIGNLLRGSLVITATGLPPVSKQ